MKVDRPYIVGRRMKVYIYMFVLYLGDWTFQKKALSIQNKGHLGSRYIYIL